MPAFIRVPKSQSLFHVRFKGESPYQVPRSWHHNSDIKQLVFTLMLMDIDASEPGYYLVTEDNQCHFIPNVEHKKVLEAVKAFRPSGYYKHQTQKMKPQQQASNKGFVQLKVDWKQVVRSKTRDRIKQLLDSESRSRAKNNQIVRVKAC